MKETRVSADAWLVGEPVCEGDVLQVCYRIGDEWQVELRSRMYAAVSGPVELVIKLRDEHDMNDSDLAEGITTELLRAIPMRDARKRLDWLATESYKESGDIDPLPKRFRTPHDYASLASLFAQRVHQGDPNPVRYLSQAYGVTRNTMAVRVRTARSQGLLTAEADNNIGALTEKAQKILDEVGPR